MTSIAGACVVVKKSTAVDLQTHGVLHSEVLPTGTKAVAMRVQVWGIFSLTGTKHPEGKNPLDTLTMISDKGSLELVYHKIFPRVPRSLGPLLPTAQRWAYVPTRRMRCFQMIILVVAPFHCFCVDYQRQCCFVPLTLAA